MKAISWLKGLIRQKILYDGPQFLRILPSPNCASKSSFKPPGGLKTHQLAEFGL